MQPNLQPLASARLLVVNTVEREVVPRALSESLSPRSPLYHALLAINAARAEGCEFAEGAASNAAVVRLHDAVRRPGRIVSTGADPFVMFAVPKGEPDDVPCIRVVVESRARAALELFLPYATPNGYGYRPDRLWTLGILPEYSDRVIVLPEYTRGLGFRLDLAADPRVGMAITSVKLGWLRRAAASTMAMVR